MRPAYLAHERVPRDAQAEKVHPQDELAADRDRVLSQQVVGDGESHPVAGPVDLDGQADVLARQYAEPGGQGSTAKPCTSTSASASQSRAMPMPAMAG